MSPQILVTGAAGGAQGSTGRRVASLLLEQGIPVRALVHKLDARSDELRRQGADVVEGDLLHPASVQAAMRDIKRAYFTYPVADGLLEAVGSSCSVKSIALPSKAHAWSGCPPATTPVPTPWSVDQHQLLPPSACARPSSDSSLVISNCDDHLFHLHTPGSEHCALRPSVTIFWSNYEIPNGAPT